MPRRELRYGSREFLAGSDLARRLPYSPRVSDLVGSVVRDPALIRVLVAVWRLPVLDLRVQRADADAWSRAHFGPARRGRLAQAVLRLPTVEEHYLAGRSKQALRTNLRHARELGVTSGRVATYEAWFEAASVILNARPDGKAVGREMDRPEPGQQVAYYIARDAQDELLAFAGVALFGQFAVVFTMLSRLDRHPGASWARYQLHTFLAIDLGRSGSSICSWAPPSGKRLAISTSSTCCATGRATCASRWSNLARPETRRPHGPRTFAVLI